MRYIFTAAICTLCAITAILALPPIGEPHALLTSQTAGDRAAVAGQTSTTVASPRQLVEPAGTSASAPATTGVLGAVELAMSEDADPAASDTTAPSENDEASRSLSIEPSTDEENNDEENSDEENKGAAAAEASTTTSTTAAPTTSTTAAPTTTTTQSPTTTAPPTTEPLPATGGVLISPKGVVLPVIGAGSEGGWRALTPCGNEVTIRDGERVLSVDFVLDPGHGGSEGGAVGPNGATEKALNLRIAEIVEWYLEDAGYSVLLTRRTDIRMPLRSRAEIANALMPDAFVSIHHNGGATRPQTTPGTEMFVDAGNPESRRLGGILFEEVTQRLSAYDAQWVGTWRNGVSARLNSEGADLYGIHRYTPDVVSVITEAGYLSNASEAALFVDNDVQWSHGRALAEGLMRWKRSSDQGSGFLDDFTDDSSSGTGGFDGCTDPSI